jgi:hypothetical protein
MQVCHSWLQFLHTNYIQQAVGCHEQPPQPAGRALCGLQMGTSAFCHVPLLASLAIRSEVILV